MNAKQTINKFIDDKKEKFIQVSDSIWDTPETRFATEKSVANYYPVLEEEGFKIEKGLAGMKHSFVAAYGNGSPVIGILAEYDALGNMSQAADTAEKEELERGGNGQGCGHNLLGAGALAGAVGIKDYMESNNLKGTIKLFGCPAEESGYGKAFMAREGAFDGVDVALTWHPMDISGAWSMSSLAVYQVYFTFKGVSSHAAAAPELGRSALDAAELMNIGVQFLREHMIDQGRIHYSYIDAGGESANVVHPTAKLYYFVRAPKINQVDEIYKRVVKISKGAAMMTETEVEIQFDAACTDFLPNEVVTTAMYQNLKDYGSLNLTEEDQQYSRRYYDSLPETTKSNLVVRARTLHPEANEEEIIRLAQMPVTDDVTPLIFSKKTVGSTDVGDVSYICPTAQVLVGCEPQGTSAHSWQWVANGKSSVAHKGILAAGKTIAATAYDLLTNPEMLAKAREEHQKSVTGQTYKPAIPKEVKPQ